MYEGGCLCGDVRYRVEGEATNLCYCHCRSCRLASGAHCVAWGTFDPARFRVTQGAITHCRSSPQVLRGACARCGTSLSYAHEARPGEIDITLASLDDATGLAPECHIWVSHKLTWVRLGDGLPQYPEARTAAG